MRVTNLFVGMERISEINSLPHYLYEMPFLLLRLPPSPRAEIIVAHGGALTGHWEFDLAIVSVFFAILSYSFLLPGDAPRGIGRVLIYGVSALFFIGALTLAVFGFRSVSLGQ